MESIPNIREKILQIADEFKKTYGGEVSSTGHGLKVVYEDFDIYIGSDDESDIIISIEIKGQQMSESDYSFNNTVSVKDIVLETFGVINGKKPTFGVSISS